MSRDRGEYRPIYEALWDGKDFQALSPEARLTLLALKGRCGALGLRAIPGLMSALAEWTGMPFEGPSNALPIGELARAGWVKVERNVAWVVRGLEFEPTLDIRNRNHRQFVRRQIEQLPTLHIVADFLERYADWFDEGYSKGYRMGIEGPSNAPPIPTPSPSPSPLVARETRAPNWCADVAKALSVVGPVSPGRVGKQLKDFVRDNPHLQAHGLDLLTQAARAYGKHVTGLTPDKAAFVKHPAEFFSRAGYWVDQVRPGGGADMLERSA